MRSCRVPAKARRLAVLLPAAGCLMAGCGRGADAPPRATGADAAKRNPASEGRPASVVGRWRGTHDDVELFQGGRLLLHQGAYRVAGTYELLEPGRMLLVYQNALAAVPPGDYRVAVTADSLTFCETDVPTRCIRYRRLAAADSTATAVPDSVARLRAVRDDGSPPSLAAPLRPDQYPPEARALEANGVLKQAYTLQQVYKADYGHYATAMDSLRVVGWQPQALRYFQQPVVDVDGEWLCIVAKPRTADLWPVHVDAAGTIGRGARCGS
jgi:hypothetical protein